MGGGGGSSKPTPAQVALENQQMQQSAQLDQQENVRRKRLLSAAQGLRVFRGSALSRAPAGNSAGSSMGGSLIPPASAPTAPRGGYSIPVTPFTQGF